MLVVMYGAKRYRQKSNRRRYIRIIAVLLGAIKLRAASTSVGHPDGLLAALFGGQCTNVALQVGKLKRFSRVHYIVTQLGGRLEIRCIIISF